MIIALYLPPPGFLDQDVGSASSHKELMELQLQVFLTMEKLVLPPVARPRPQV